MIADYGGLAKLMPVYATFFLIITLSSIGLPALNGFIGEFIILVGRLQTASGSVGASSRRLGHRAGRGLHAVALPAGLLRSDHQPGEHAACPT